jgi:hypothetical protein
MERRFRLRPMARQVGPPKLISRLIAASLGFIKRMRAGSNSKPQAQPILSVAGYNLVLVDRDGQVTWTREWDAGSTFKFGPHFTLWVFCEFTNRSRQQVEIAEYEIELMSDEGLVVERFGEGFVDSVIVAAGETKVFTGQWRL